jgi:hypothetical protein
MGAFNDIAGKHAEEVLLDDVGFVIFDAYEPVRDVEPVADFLRPRLDKVELSRVGEPAGDQRRRVFGPRTLAKAGGMSARNATPRVKHASIADAS